MDPGRGLRAAQRACDNERVMRLASPLALTRSERDGDRALPALNRTKYKADTTAMARYAWSCMVSLEAEARALYKQ